MNEPEINELGLPKRVAYTRPVVPDESKNSNCILTMSGQLEFDWRRGVMYFHAIDGRTVLRICQLPKSDYAPSKDFMIDIAHMTGLTYVGK